MDSEAILRTFDFSDFEQQFRMKVGALLSLISGVVFYLNSGLVFYLISGVIFYLISGVIFYLISGGIFYISQGIRDVKNILVPRIFFFWYIVRVSKLCVHIYLY